MIENRVSTSEFVERIAKNHGLTKKQSKEIIHDFLGMVATESSEGKTVLLHGLGTIKSRVTKAHTRRIGSAVHDVPEHRRLVLRARPMLRNGSA
jgi:nucleoid DNA-binding protein